MQKTLGKSGSLPCPFKGSYLIAGTIFLRGVLGRIFRISK